MKIIDNDIFKDFLINGQYFVKHRTIVRGEGAIIQIKENVKVLRPLKTPFVYLIFAKVDKNCFDLKISVYL